MRMRRRDLMIATAGPVLAAGPAWAQQDAPAAAGGLRRAIPRSSERIPAVGMGTWITFNVSIQEPAAMAQRRAVLEQFFAAGGGMIDSSPMYGQAEHVLGELLRDLPGQGGLFRATKVWTPFTAAGRRQLEMSLSLWRAPRFHLLQVHNLLNWRAHLKTLREWQQQGRTRYIGVTTSHGRAHDEMAAILRSEPLDFMQVTYNPADRSAEPLLALAADRGVAVIVNRPFDGGALLDRLARRPLPALAAELGCSSWAAFVLKWELGHPAVTCVIPATTQPAHMAQNMAALQGPLPDAGQRGRMLEAMGGGA
jgi:diketogulonate reductase-like aldo/keto reductase